MSDKIVHCVAIVGEKPFFRKSFGIFSWHLIFLKHQFLCKHTFSVLSTNIYSLSIVVSYISHTVLIIFMKF